MQVRLTEVEFEMLDRLAREEGLATAALVREAALGFIVAERLRTGESALDRRMSRLAQPEPNPFLQVGD